MKETEVTVQVFNDFEETCAILAARDFELADRFVIKDRYYSGLANAKDLPYGELIKNSFLVREIICEKETSAFLIYKQKDIDEKGVVIAEEKVKVSIGDPEKADRIFGLSGIDSYCEIENSTCVFKKGSICLALQDVRDLGLFIEYEEDETMKALDPVRKTELLKEVLTGLGLKLGSDFSCKKVYMKLHPEA